MKQLRLTERFQTFFQAAHSLAVSVRADAVLLLLEQPADWQSLAEWAGQMPLLVAADDPACLEGAKDGGLKSVMLDTGDRPVSAKLEQALLEAVADDMLPTAARVVAVYSAFEEGNMDTISIIGLSEHLGRLTVRDLQQLETSVPLDTLQTVVNLAVEIGREGREGKPVGTLFVVGDARKVLTMTRPTGFDPVRGYQRKERNLKSARVREGIKEIALMDGAFVISADATVDAAARYIDAPAVDITLSKGLGARHWAAASITKATKAIAVAVSESNGTVRIFQNGEVILRIESFRRPMKWKGEFEDLEGETLAGE